MVPTDPHEPFPEPTREEYEADLRRRREKLGPDRIVTAKELAANMFARAGITSRPYREYAVRPIDVLRALGVKKIRQSGDQLQCSSPLRDNDRNPSFSMQADKRGRWTDHGLVAEDGVSKLTGNLVDLLVLKLGISPKQAHARLMEGDIHKPVKIGADRERKTARCGGSKKEIASQLKRAAHLVQTKMPRTDAVRVLVREFGVSRSTAYSRIRMASSAPAPIPAEGKRLGIRSYASLRLLRGEQWVRLQARQIRAYYEKRKSGRVGRSESADRFLDAPRGRQKARPPTIRHPRASGRGSIKTDWHPLFNPA